MNNKKLNKKSERTTPFHEYVARSFLFSVFFACRCVLVCVCMWWSVEQVHSISSVRMFFILVSFSVILFTLMCVVLHAFCNIFLLKICPTLSFSSFLLSHSHSPFFRSFIRMNSFSIGKAIGLYIWLCATVYRQFSVQMKQIPFSYNWP